MASPDVIEVHPHSIRNRDELIRSDRCGCFYCGATFPPDEVREWTDDRDGVGQTALCPRCGIDSVLGSATGFPITPTFLAAMRAHWFGA